MHHGPTIRYEELEPLRRTGDVVLVHDASRRSRIIQAAKEGEFSHIGMGPARDDRGACTRNSGWADVMSHAVL